MSWPEFQNPGDGKQQKGLTLIPLAVYLKQRRIKVALGLCRGKSKVDKRETLKRRDDEHRMRQAMRRDK